MIYLKENKDHLYIPERSDIYKAEANFIMAKIYLFKADKIDENFLQNAEKYLKKALKIQTPRRYLHILYYIYYRIILLKQYKMPQ